ncbi:PREDICTED: uncharacterized protein LOC101314046 [Fragaria vesca subsp. vesca]|uniref:uncharacterized protein LOC101314046 n=1 Tax=Fragaria vesca subsp. vesca TaxID=101020 RepID=UPI0002C332D0|nr:PREDICTED: uncharacterized protein LOC101314046 [Fragaria vesca subsp. vesca]
MSTLKLDSLSPAETVEIENGLSLVPRLRLNITVYPSSQVVSKPIDEWKMKQTLIDFMKSSLSDPIMVPEEDLKIRRVKDLKKRKRDDPVASGTIFIRDLGFLRKKSRKDEDEERSVEEVEKKFRDWRRYIVEKMDGIELNLEGVKFKLNVAVPESDDFNGMKKGWEEFHAFGNRGFSKKQETDTIILRGVPSRWFAEPRVSSKPSMLVTHTIFSTFGKIRNLNVAEDDDPGKDANEDGGDLVSGLHCKIVVQFEKHKDFYNTFKSFCGRSLQKEGSKMKADYEVAWDKDGFFLNLRNQTQENSSRARETTTYPRQQQHFSRFSANEAPRKRFKE